MLFFLVFMLNLLVKEFDSEIQYFHQKNDSLFLVSGTNIYNIDVNNFNLVWKREKECAYLSGVEKINDKYLITEWCGKLYTIDKNGEKINERFLDAAVSSPFIWGDNIFILAKDGNLYCLDNDLNIIWKRQMGKPSYYWDNPFILVDKRLLVKYFWDNKFNIALIDPFTGDELWKVPFGFRKGIVSGESIFVLLGEKSDILYGLDAKDGNVFLKIYFKKFIEDFGILKDNIFIISGGKIYFYDIDGRELKKINLDKRKGKAIFLKGDRLFLWDGKDITIYEIGKNNYKALGFDVKDLYKKKIKIIEDGRNYLIIAFKNKIYKFNYILE